MINGEIRNEEKVIMNAIRFRLTYHKLKLIYTTLEMHKIETLEEFMPTFKIRKQTIPIMKVTSNATRQPNQLIIMRVQTRTKKTKQMYTHHAPLNMKMIIRNFELNKTSLMLGLIMSLIRTRTMLRLKKQSW